MKLFLTVAFTLVAPLSAYEEHYNSGSNTDCSVTTDCISTEYCYNHEGAGKCRTRGGEGANCFSGDYESMFNEDNVCMPPLICSSSACTAPKAEGDDCGFTSECNDGLYCDSICKAKIASGGSCTEISSYTQESCADGLYCDAIGELEGSTGQCAALKANGASCSYGAECNTGFCDSESSECFDIGAALGAAVGGFVLMLFLPWIIAGLIGVCCCIAIICYCMKKGNNKAAPVPVAAVAAAPIAVAAAPIAVAAAPAYATAPPPPAP